MPIKSDCHLHSSHSSDSKEPMELMVQKAIDLGLSHICFTEHMDMDYPPAPNGSIEHFNLNTDSYLFDIIRYKEKYAGRIKVLFGVELGLQAQIVKANLKYIKEHDFDFVIASTHVCGGRDPYFPEYWRGRSEEEALREYFETELNNIRAFSQCDVYGHLDYAVRYAPSLDSGYSYDKYKDLLDRILVLILEQERGIELNTGGLLKGLRSPHPCMELLKRYRALGGGIITVGSDAHCAANIAYGFDSAADFLRECGYQYYCIFEGRVPEFIKI